VSRRLLLFAIILSLSSCRDQPEPKQVQAVFDKETGKLRQLTYDSDNNGTPDSWSYMDGTKVLRVEVDKNEDGLIERWEYYGADNKLEKVGLSRALDGKVDTWAYRAPDGTLDRIEISTRRDGKVSRTEFYEKGALVRVQEDTDGNGALDKWETYASGAVTSVAFDTEGAGRPTRRLVYGRDGNVVRVDTGDDLDRAPPQP